MKKIIFLAVLLICSAASINAQDKASIHKIVNRFHLDGDASWDYLAIDETENAAYISHGNIVQIMDLKDGKLLGTISGLNGVHGIAIAKDLNKGFISSGRDSSVTVFELKTLKVLTKIQVTGKNPDAILYDPFSHLVFTFNGRTANTTVIDAKTNLVKATIALDGKPEFAVTDLKGRIFVNIEDKNMINVINVNTLKVEKHWSIAPGDEPSGLALDNENHRLFSVCGNKMMVVTDAETGKQITNLPIGDRTDGVAFDPVKKQAYSSNGDGTITVVKEENKDKFVVTETIITQKGARTIAINTKTQHLYLPTAEFNPVPEPTTENPKPRAGVKPGSFVILDIDIK
ncbi:MAG: YncE family protein [Bacteroidetes bacterium]|nr:YncE family protein [Bacteroidota bacterium]